MANISLMRGYDVVVCRGCGFVYADGIPSSEAFVTYYAEASKYEYAHRSGQQHNAEQQRLAHLARRIADIVPSSARLIDVGCSTGELLAYLRSCGLRELTGMDPSATCVEYARRKHDVRMIQQMLGPKPVDETPFEVAVLSAVLEHVPDLHMFLGFLDNWLTVDGLLVVEVPDAERFAASLNAPYQEFSVEHINFFSGPSLDNLLGLHKYVPIAKYQDLCSVGGNFTASVLTGMYQRSDRQIPPAREVSSEIGLEAYLTRCSAAVGCEHAVIDALVGSQKPIVVWGVGTLCQRLLATTSLNRANICAFVDSNSHYQGASLVGKRILAPGELRGRNEAILILSWGFGDEIEHQLRNELLLGNDIIRIDNPSRARLQ